MVQRVVSMAANKQYSLLNRATNSIYMDIQAVERVQLVQFVARYDMAFSDPSQLLKNYVIIRLAWLEFECSVRQATEGNQGYG